MSEQCPYCNRHIEINHDLSEDDDIYKTYMDECRYCGKTLKYQIEVNIDYYISKCGCMNGEPHNLVDEKTYPEAFAVGWKRCTECNEKFLVDEEANSKAMEEYKKNITNFIRS